MEKIIVTGVNGFVGHHLTDELIAQGYEVVGVGRDAEVDANLRDKLSSYHSCDLADQKAVDQLPLDGLKAIINLAGLAAVGPSFDNPELYMRVNTGVLSTFTNRLRALNRKDTRIVTVSSGAVYASDQPMPITESSATNVASSPYVASKLAMEKIAQEFRNDGFDCVITRPFNHIGPGQTTGFLLPDLYQKITEAMISGKQLLVGNITTRRDYTDVRDVAKAYVSLATHPSVEHDIYNVCTGRSLSGEEILALVLEQLQISDLQAEIDPTLFRPSDAPDLYGDNHRLQNETNWRPEIDIRQTIADFVTSKA